VGLDAGGVTTSPASTAAAVNGARPNDQRTNAICFHWRDGDAHDVEIVDYH
jgi:hypothetical protein